MCVCVVRSLEEVMDGKANTSEVCVCVCVVRALEEVMDGKGSTSEVCVCVSIYLRGSCWTSACGASPSPSSPWA